MKSKKQKLSYFWLGVIVVLTIAAVGTAPILISTGLRSGKTIYVDSVNGNDSSGSRITGMPFLTLTAAKNAATSGDTIKVRSGTYLGTNLLKNGINYYFYAGATVTNLGTNPVRDSASIFNDYGGATTNSISGEGVFKIDFGNNINIPTVGANAVVSLSNLNSRVTFSGRAVHVRNVSSGDNVAAFWITNCSRFECSLSDGIYDLNIDSPALDEFLEPLASRAMGIYWVNGDCYFNTPKMIIENGYGIWSDGTTNDLYYRGHYIKTSFGNAFYTSSSSNKNKLWIDALEVDAGAQIISTIAGSGFIYLNAQKLKGAAPAIQCQGQEYWITAQKFTAASMDANGSFFRLFYGKSFIRVLQYEHEAAGAGVAISIEGGTNLFEGGQIIVTNCIGVKVSGSHSTRLKDMVIQVVDSAGSGNTNWCIRNLTNGLTVQNIVLKAPAAAFAVWSTNVNNHLNIEGILYADGTSSGTNSVTTITNGVYKIRGDPSRL